MTYNSGKGKGVKFLLDLIEDAPPSCVTWPMFRDANGYGKVGYLGKLWWAHTLVCTMAYGEKPADNFEATHSCGNGKLGCVNPRHLSWGTRSRNQLDRRFHGTKAKGYRVPKLNADQAADIRRLAGIKTQREIAEKFGVTDATVRDIQSGKTWRTAS